MDSRQQGASKALLLFDDASSRTVRVEISDPSKRSAVTGEGWLSVTLREDGIYATQADKPGLWQIDHGVRLVTAQYPRDEGEQLAFVGDKVLVPDFSSDPARLFAQPLAGGPAAPIAYAPKLSPNTNFAVDPRSGRIVYVSDVERDFGIDILRLVER